MVQVKLHIHDQIHEDYFRWLFTHTKAGRRKIITPEIAINPKFDLGKTIISQVKTAGRPKQSFGQNFITISLPLENLKKDQCFIYFDEFATQQINYAIAAQFDIDFRDFCVSGREKGIKIFIVVQAFMRMYNIRNSPDLFERLKKKDYRRRKILDQFLIQGIKNLEGSLQYTDNQN
jgi:hypothetical protein